MKNRLLPDDVISIPNTADVAGAIARFQLVARAHADFALLALARELLIQSGFIGGREAGDGA